MNAERTFEPPSGVRPVKLSGYEEQIIDPPSTSQSLFRHQDHYAEKEFILTGYERDIVQVLSVPPTRLPTVNRIGEISLGLSRGRVGPRPQEPPDEFKICFYQIDSDESVRDLLEDIYQRAIENRLLVFAEPDRAIFSAEEMNVWGNPECVEGGPAGGSSETGKGRFSGQWAFGKRGIRLLKGKKNALERVTTLTGQGVQIGLFDASPFPEPGGWCIPWAQWPLKMCVSHPYQGASALFTGLEKFCDHGLFAAGLAHAVAPESKIHLIRVLNDKNKGSLSRLCYAIQAFIDKATEDSEIQRAVINLSLAVDLPPDLGAMRLPNLPDLEDTLFATLGRTRPREWPRLDTPSLDALLLEAYEKGIVVVASAGNESTCPVHAEPSLIPAAYPQVLGIAGSNISRARALFSNAGDVAAPSGDSRPGCWPRWFPFDTEWASRLVSLSMRISPPSGYAYWGGTSFAAPLASGLAALLLQQNHTLSPQQVYDRIQARAIVQPDGALGAGIVDVPNTLK
jgi:hypothetical protein